MNILFISRNSPFESIGGIERYLTNLIVYYKNLTNSDIRLFLMLPTDKKNYSEKEKNVEIFFDKSLFYLEIL